MKGDVNSTSTDAADELPNAIGADADSDALQLKKQARRRLIGAIALALFGVIVLPMVMDGQPRPVAPEIQVHIPSQDGPGFTGKIVPGSAVKPTPMPSTLPAAATTTAPKSDAANTPQNAPEASAQAVSAKVAEVNKSVDATPSKAPSSPVVKPKPSAAKITEPTKKSTETASTEAKPNNDEPRALAALTGTESLSAPWFVQLGAYKDAGNVKTLLAKVKEMKIAVSTEKIESSAGPRIRVRAGPFATRAEAEKAQTRILTIKVSGVLSQ